MNNSIHYRGPDGGGELIINNLAIGMKRLSIIDLSLGNQPMSHPDYQVSIVFNGEIYNYKELKLELVQKKFIFYTNSDTEVIIVAYVAYGLDFINKLKGMFSFCLIDSKKNVSYIFRDRAGEKPLYYMNLPNKLIFSSEIKGILSVLNLKLKLNKIALNQYFQLRYIPSPLTIFDGIFKLKPGHYLRIIDNKIEEFCYWKLSPQHLLKEKNISEWSKELYGLMDKSISGCLEADVPIGVFLSGGIDSSIVTGIAALQSKNKLNTFTVKFKEKDYDESDRAKLIAKKFNTNHKEIVIESKNFIEHLEQLFLYIDEPFADSSLLPAYVISKEAKKYVKTIITGDGADELFAGYNKYSIFYYSNLLGKAPKIIQFLIKFLISKINKNSITFRKFSKVINLYKLNNIEKAISLMSNGFNRTQLSSLLNKNYFEQNSLNFLYEKFNNSKYEDIVGKILNVDFETILEGDMLTKMDRASMYASLEIRAPFLDKDVIEFANKLPSKYKIFRNNKKIILKKAFSNLLPKKTFLFSKKGFSIPLSEFISKYLSSDFLHLFNDEFISIQGIFNSDFINTIYNNHINNKENYSDQIFTYYVFQKWYLKFQKFIQV
jgi:asparagine synthase (glutamine-hydrolysing)